MDPAVRDAKRLTFEAKLKAIGVQAKIVDPVQVIMLICCGHDHIVGKLDIMLKVYE